MTTADLIYQQTPQQAATDMRDLDSLFGAWTEEEFRSIQGSISAERRIDPELWQ